MPLGLQVLLYASSEKIGNSETRDDNLLGFGWVFFLINALPLVVSLSAKNNNSTTKLQVLGYNWQSDFNLLGLGQVVDDGIIYVHFTPSPPVLPPGF